MNKLISRAIDRVRHAGHQHENTMQDLFKALIADGWKHQGGENFDHPRLGRTRAVGPLVVAMKADGTPIGAHASSLLAIEKLYKEYSDAN